MSTRGSFRSQLVIGSLLWTIGVLLTVSVLLIVFLAEHPTPHRMIFDWTASSPLVLTISAGAGLMAAGVWRIRRSLSAVDRLRVRLAAVHRGDERQVAGRYPAEVQPLVDDLNALLAEREQRVQRAVAKAGDLAHGLKTPLAVLTGDAVRAAATGHAELAGSMAAQVERMRRQIDYHLAHARAAAARETPGLRSLVAPSVEGLFRTLERLHAGRAISLQMSVPATHAVRCRREDLEEILGNLLDNACKWGRTQVRVESMVTEAGVSIAVDDDGPGLEPSLASEVLRRGVRADQHVPGSGLGLAIVSDLMELYGGTIDLTRSPMGGLRGHLQLPSAEG